MVHLGAMNWFDSFIKKLKKALDCINHVIYTPVYIESDRTTLHSNVEQHALIAARTRQIFKATWYLNMLIIKGL